MRKSKKSKNLKFSELIDYTKKKFNPSNKNNFSKESAEEPSGKEQINLLKSILKPITQMSYWTKEILDLQKSNSILFKDINDSLITLRQTNGQELSNSESFTPMVRELSDINQSIEQLKLSNKKEEDQNQAFQKQNNSYLSNLLSIFEKRRFREEEEDLEKERERQRQKTSSPGMSIPSGPSSGLGSVLAKLLSSIFLGPKGMSLLTSLIPKSLGAAGLALTKGIAGLLLGPKLLESLQKAFEEENVTAGVGTFIDEFFNDDMLNNLGKGALLGFMTMGGIRGIVPGLMIGGAMTTLHAIFGKDATSKILTGTPDMLKETFLMAGLGALVGSKFGIPGIILGAAFGSLLGVINAKDTKFNVASITMAALGGLGGALAGMKIGMLIGSVGTPVGMMAGGMLGVTIGLAVASVISSDQLSASEEATKKFSKAALAKSELLKKYNGDVSKMSPEDLKLLEQYDNELNFATKQFESEGITPENISSSISLLETEDENARLIGSRTADESYYDTLANQILSKSENEKYSKLSDVLDVDPENSTAITKVAMKDSMGNIQPAGVPLSKINDQFDTKLFTALRRISAQDDSVIGLDDFDEEDRQMIEVQKKIIQRDVKNIKNNFSNSDQIDNSNNVKEQVVEENQTTLLDNNQSNNQFSSKTENNTENNNQNNNQRTQTSNDQSTSYTSQDTKSLNEQAAERLNAVYNLHTQQLKENIQKFNQINNLNIKNFGEIFEYDDEKKTLVLSKDIDYTFKKNQFGKEISENRQLKKGSPIRNMVGLRDENSIVQNYIHLAKNRMQLSQFLPGTAEKNSIPDVINNQILKVPEFKTGAVFTKPQLFIAGESPKNNPEFLFNRQQMENLGHIFSMQNENEKMKSNLTIGAPIIAPGNNSNYIDNKRISVQEYNITEIPPEPNSSVSFKDILSY